MNRDELAPKEKEYLQSMVADLMLSVLWDPKTTEAHGDTLWHHVRVWREGDTIKAEIKQVR